VQLEGAERMVLQAIHDIPGHLPGYVADSKIADITRIPLPTVRDYLETLEGKGFIQRARTADGDSAYISAKGRLALTESTPTGGSTGFTKSKPTPPSGIITRRSSHWRRIAVILTLFTLLIVLVGLGVLRTWHFLVVQNGGFDSQKTTKTGLDYCGYTPSGKELKDNSTVGGIHISWVSDIVRQGGSSDLIYIIKNDSREIVYKGAWTTEQSERVFMEIANLPPGKCMRVSVPDTKKWKKESTKISLDWPDHPTKAILVEAYVPE
jgi:hypothetical protein